MRITINWFDDEAAIEADRPDETMTANSELDAEGLLAVMGRHYQKRVAERQGEETPEKGEDLATQEKIQK